MAFAKKQQNSPRLSAGRLAAVAGGPSFSAAAAEAGSPRPRVTVEPDLSRIRPRGVSETPEQRQRRLAAKTINFSMTFLARIVIMAAVAYLMLGVYEGTGSLHRGYGTAMFLMIADFGRVVLKAMAPGTK